MDYIYAVLLLHNAKKEITDANVKAVLTAAGVSVDDGKLKGLLASLKEVNIAEAIEKASMPVAAAAGPAAEVKEEKKEEEVEVSEESAAEGLGSLFG
ncbi:MAG: 50S ribosomal protein P1 [Candidatus ainarchaeum sp.]|jgi:large subunit ribosomal protein L12|nr:50S ribosomal protein P1 [Candidatus ainarchaeum sp.]